MVTKLKVKDLAAELGIGHKEILQHLRDMDIQVKSFMSTLEDDEVDRVRQSLKGAQPEATEVVRREVQPGVIVRSRKSRPAGHDEPEAPRKRAAEAAPAAQAEEKPAAPVAAEEPMAPAAEPVKAEEPKAEPVAAEKPARIVSESAPAESQPAPEAPATARIVKPAAKSAPEAKIVATPEVEPKAEPKAEAKAEEKPAAKPAEAPAAAPSAQAAPATQNARIIRPAGAEPVQPELPKAEAPVAAEPEAKAEDKAEAGAPKAEAKPEEAKAAEPASETPSAGDDDEKRKRKPKREVIVPAAPQVRIISRPDPSQVQAQQQARRPEYSASGEGSGARPYTPRPGQGGYQPRPGGDRPGGDRPDRGGDRPDRGGDRPTGGYQRPAGPGGAPRPGAAPSLPPKEGEDRTRRGTRDRRVVEFPGGGGGGGSDDDRRKAGPSTAKKKPSFAPAPVISEDGDAPMRLKSSRHKKRRPGPEQREEQKPVGKRKIRIDEHIRLSDLAHQMGIKAQAIIKVLFGMGMMATINQALDLDTATLIAGEFGHEAESVGFDEQEFLTGGSPDSTEDLKPRPPVVTIMGHVDHGKTSLLDAIRKTSIASGEAGGITQHIGAYHVTTSRGEVVFLDTPGHEAFTAMRARGAQVTDIVVLVVAADDGVMDQTREAINHSKAAGVPIVVAVNKIDKEGANPDRVKRELAEFDLVPEDWGGTTIFANVSAKQRIGLDELLEMILLQAEVLELKANPSKLARGHIVEAKLDKGRGPLGTVLIQEGTLKPGDAFVCGTVHGKVRAMFNDQGRKIKLAGPAIPVEIQGFDVVPEAGDEFVCVADDKVARKIAETRAAKQREKDMIGKSSVTLESFLKSRPDHEAKSLNLVLKADVQGSLEAITEALNKLSTDEVKISVVHGGTGGLTESDIMLATASQAIIIGFNVRPTAKVKEVADREKVEIRFYDIIYKLVGEIKDAMSGMLAPDIQEVYLGQAEVRNTFNVPKVGTVAGCGVVDGKLIRTAKVRLLRDGVVIYTGALSSLKRFKDDAKEVMKGYECGVGLENFNDIKIGDVIEAFETKEVARTID
jgi:translation initiation factor IF-2